MESFDLIGKTPIVELKNIFKKPGVRVFAKLEGQNPGGSVKDRAAYNMINEAIKRRNIKKGDYLVEATSGNTGIALAMIARGKGRSAPRLSSVRLSPGLGILRRVIVDQHFQATILELLVERL